jgi:ATP-binding protein involved in chromosome partitioning
MRASEQLVEEAVARVVEPELRATLAELGLVLGVEARRGRVRATVGLVAADHPQRDELVARVRGALEAAAGADGARADVVLEVLSEAEAGEVGERLRATGRQGAVGERTRVLGVSSGKGGVGKSSVTVNLAVALARLGRSVAVLDADVYGFSVPRMVGIDRPPLVLGGLVVPPVRHGVAWMSLGLFVDDETPVIWRGPMLHKALEQLLSDAYWGEPDFLVCDMPPGTGDVALSMAQYLPRAEVVVVTTPQAAAQRVAQRSAFMARKLKLPVRGVVENMSYFTGLDGHRYEIFGTGGGEALASALGVPLLGQIPLVEAVRTGGDEGVPVTVADPSGDAARAFDELAARVVALGPARVYRSELTVR